MEKEDLPEKIDFKNELLEHTNMIALRTGIDSLELHLVVNRAYIIRKEYNKRENLSHSLPYSFEQ